MNLPPQKQSQKPKPDSMKNDRPYFIASLARSMLLLLVWNVASALKADEGLEFFEAKIRPVLIERCYECHNSVDRAEANLELDHRQGVIAGGDSGPAIHPGKPDDSLLIQAIRHQGDLRMPEDNPKLSPKIVADFVHWIEIGAPDPRDEKPNAQELQQAISWPAIRDQRMQWWSFQPVKPTEPPPVINQGWSSDPVDRFILSRLETHQLAPADKAEKLQLLRRLCFVITGLPPSEADIIDFLNAPNEDTAYAALVDKLLESPQYGERWARHWMDCFRFAESHGSEGDPAIPYAYRYRDYLIRAFNEDVPYDQLVREHLAGDLIENPRINSDQTNESMIGLAHFRMVEHGYAPIDALEERVRFTDNQIDVVSKAFLGLTVSCARCHDHKFDPISQQDFYALYGIFASCRPAVVTTDLPGRVEHQRQSLQQLKQSIRQQIADVWLQQVDQLIEELPEAGTEPNEKWQAIIDSDQKTAGPLHAWLELRGLNGNAFETKVAESRAAHHARQNDAANDLHSKAARSWNLGGANKEYDARDAWQTNWHRSGNADLISSLPGEFAIQQQGNSVIQSIMPAGVYSHRLSSKFNAVLNSPDFEIDFDTLWIRMAGDGSARARFVIEDYPRSIGLLYKSLNPNSRTPTWQAFDLTYFKGDRMHLEIATGGDLPVEINGNPDSWFGISEIVGLNKADAPPSEQTNSLWNVVDSNLEVKDADQLRKLYGDALRAVISAWQTNRMSDEQAALLDFFVTNDLLINHLPQFEQLHPETANSIHRYRQLAGEIPEPSRAPGIEESTGADHPLFIRGNHKTPADVVPRGFVQALKDHRYQTSVSGRLELANDITDRNNPLFARVIVNRVWQHIFGSGLVATTDNFGRLGTEPSHPELLDYLADHFIQDGYSIKRLVRSLLLTRTFQQQSVASVSSREIDPDNRLLSHYPVRRLEAEAIRDAMLSISGRLDRTLGGASVGDNSSRRSIYLRIVRNAPDEFLTTFDLPVPFSTKGTRDVTNVPAQSLTIMNSPFVRDQSTAWGRKILLESPQAATRERIERFFLQGLARMPSELELHQSEEFLIAAYQRLALLQQEKLELQQMLVKHQQALAELSDPIRQRLLEAKLLDLPQGDALTAQDLHPIARWEFDEDLRDSIGNLHAKSIGHTKIVDGSVVFTGDGFLQTAKLGQTIKAKTLEVWLSLDDLNQTGSGIMTIQSVGGARFDSIVFAEREARCWMAGSNFFERTRSFNAAAESAGADEQIHLAIVYAENGSITCYRNGSQYGEAYQSSGPEQFASDQSEILFGMRHGAADSRRGLAKARIHRAQFYDRALSLDEIIASFSGTPHVSEEEVLLAMTADQLQRFHNLQDEIEKTRTLLAPLEQFQISDDPNQSWYEFAHAIFNLKEFIYVR
jgi:hypothetical protein